MVPVNRIGFRVAHGCKYDAAALSLLQYVLSYFWGPVISVLVIKRIFSDGDGVFWTERGTPVTCHAQPVVGSNLVLELYSAETAVDNAALAPPALLMVNVHYEFAGSCDSIIPPPYSVYL